ncbi:protein-cysteine N-palmitoyltransferase HHAT isoform X3 [Silurus meridionalis]|uniref:protein-cysteine N-palmitoyltransferase HHAT isoform X3 n=1 Tax=Silurus meridionalis TaxID=175797 RepID=UPI001EE9CF71|nr:protein-cysteine N-palmitoyltransferase HHAT isoform X3 [Silurus meridionalis]
MECAVLPQSEMILYCLVSFTSHLYSFYQLHVFSTEHEESLDREVQLEDGFLITGSKKDASDFEWSFWNEWAWRSLLWSLIGHAVVSQLCSVCSPQLRKAILTVYGVLCAWWLLGWRGVVVLMLHLSISLAVAQLQSSALTWVCALFLLSTLHITSIQEVQMDRMVCSTSPSWLLSQVLRLCVWWCLAEFMIHFMYMHSIQNNEIFLNMLPSWALGGLALALVQFFYVKYLVLFGVASLLMKLDGVEPPPLPRCVSTMYSFQGMWRQFDVGLYRWLIRYVYIPLGGSQHGLFQKLISMAMAFSFVCLWHGCHDYLQCWALLNWVCVFTEISITHFLCWPPLHHTVLCFLTPPMRRRGLALISAFSTALLILSNLVFLGGIHVGRVYWRRVFLEGWFTMGVPVLGCLYCFAQVGLEVDRKRK